MADQEGYLIIDIGTGNVRVAVTDTRGEIVSIERGDLPYLKDINYPEALYFEPDALWEQIRELAKTALSKAPAIQIKAITASSQREGIVAIGKQGESLIGMPNIDHRGREWEHLLQDKSEVYLLTGRYPTSLFSAFKLIGLRQQRPDIWSQFSTFMSISDWAEYKMSGVVHYEHSQASESLLYDVEKKSWSSHLCNLFDISPAALPVLTASGTVLGSILPAEAEALNISAAAKIIVGGADTQLAVMSIEPEENDVIVVSGTTTPVIKVTGSYDTDPQERTWTGRHTDEHSFMIEANAGVTGLNYQRLKEIFYPNEDYHVIESELGEITPGQCIAALGSLVAGEKKPLTRGGFIFDTPVSHQLSRADFVWATLWDMACSIFENYKSLVEVSGHQKDYLWACGGGLQSRTLRQFIANLVGKKIIIRKSYQQASVTGGVYTCNKAFGMQPLTADILEEIFPQDAEYFEKLYLEWKQNRYSLKERFN